MKSRYVKILISVFAFCGCLLGIIVSTHPEATDPDKATGTGETSSNAEAREYWPEKAGDMKVCLACRCSSQIRTEFDPEPSYSRGALFYDGESVEVAVRLSVRQDGEAVPVPEPWYQTVEICVRREAGAARLPAQKEPKVELLGQPRTTSEPPLYDPSLMNLGWKTFVQEFRMKDLIPSPAGQPYTVWATIELCLAGEKEEAIRLRSAPVRFTYKQPTSERERASLEGRQAVRERWNKQFEASEARLKRLLEKWPQSQGIWFQLGMVAFDQAKYEEAIAYLEKALAIAPKNEGVWAQLELARRELAKSKKQGSP